MLILCCQNKLNEIHHCFVKLHFKIWLKLDKLLNSHMLIIILFILPVICNFIGSFDFINIFNILYTNLPLGALSCLCSMLETENWNNTRYSVSTILPHFVTDRQLNLRPFDQEI